MYLNIMKIHELDGIAREHFKTLKAYIAYDLGAEKMEALSKIIYFLNKDHIYRILRFDPFTNDSNFYYKRDFTAKDFINAFRLLLNDNDIKEFKRYANELDLLSYRAKISDKFLIKIYNWVECNNMYVQYDLYDMFILAKALIADKYYDYFTRENIIKFLKKLKKIKKNYKIS